jgi:hypothetical protein
LTNGHERQQGNRENDQHAEGYVLLAHRTPRGSLAVYNHGRSRSSLADRQEITKWPPSDTPAAHS